MRLTVVQILPALNMGGVERGTLEVGRALVRAGHRSIVISAGGHLVDRLQADGSEHIAWPLDQKSLLSLRLISKLRRLLETEQVDILHARSRLPAWVSYLAWRGMRESNRPHFVTTVHGANSVNWYSRIMTRGEKVIAVSGFIRDYILQHYPETPPDRISVIPRGIDPDEFPYDYQPSTSWQAGWQQQYPQLQGQWLVTLPARLTRRKGHEDFIEIMRKLHADNIKAYGLVVGGVDPKHHAYAESLHALVKKHALENHILFTGQRDDLKDIMAISTLVMSLSTAPESFGRVALEALSLGRPVIAYDHGGNAEILRQLYPTGLTPLRDTAAAAMLVRKLLLQAPAVSRENPFTLENMLAVTIATYTSLQQTH
ncbi:MAG: glycosyltransferase family 4 protein [Gammaproteobacteria bacterium]